MEREILGKAAAWFAREAIRSRSGLRIREGAPGLLPHPDDVSRAGTLRQWLLRMAEAAAVGPRAGDRRTGGEDPGDLRRKRRVVRVAAGLRRAGGAEGPGGSEPDRPGHEAGGDPGREPRKWARTTVRDKDARPAPDLVDRNFTADGPDQLWVADITYVPTWAGFLYLAVVLDVWSRRIVGWAMATHLRTELVLEALDMALVQRRPKDVIHHSDQGSQYTSLAFGRRCEVMSGPRWARWATPTTTRCARGSSQRWRANCSTGNASRPRPRRWQSSRNRGVVQPPAPALRARLAVAGQLRAAPRRAGGSRCCVIPRPHRPSRPATAGKRGSPRGGGQIENPSTHLSTKAGQLHSHVAFRLLPILFAPVTCLEES